MRRAPKNPNIRAILQGDVMREAPPPHSIILIYRKPLRSITNRLKLRDESVVRLDRSLYRRIVR
jgi:hypothetical protein